MTKDKSCDSQYVAADELHNACVPQSVNIEYTCILDFYSPVAQGFKITVSLGITYMCVYLHVHTMAHNIYSESWYYQHLTCCCQCVNYVDCVLTLHSSHSPLECAKIVAVSQSNCTGVEVHLSSHDVMPSKILIHSLPNRGKEREEEREGGGATILKF